MKVEAGWEDYNGRPGRCNPPVKRPRVSLRTNGKTVVDDKNEPEDAELCRQLNGQRIYMYGPQRLDEMGRVLHFYGNFYGAFLANNVPEPVPSDPTQSGSSIFFALLSACQSRRQRVMGALDVKYSLTASE